MFNLFSLLSLSFPCVSLPLSSFSFNVLFPTLFLFLHLHIPLCYISFPLSYFFSFPHLYFTLSYFAFPPFLLFCFYPFLVFSSHLPLRLPLSLFHYFTVSTTPSCAIVAPAERLASKVLAMTPSPPQHLALSANQQVLSVVARDEAGKLTIFFYKLQHFFSVSIEHGGMSICIVPGTTIPMLVHSGEEVHDFKWD